MKTLGFTRHRASHVSRCIRRGSSHTCLIASQLKGQMMEGRRKRRRRCGEGVGWGCATRIWYKLNSREWRMNSCSLVFYSRLKANRFVFHFWLFTLKILAMLKNVKGKMILKHLSDVICRIALPNIEGGIPLHIKLPWVDDTYFNCFVIVWLL